MTSIFDKTTRDGLITRINLLDEKSTARWGKMTVYQMVKHCTLFEEMALGKTQYKRLLIGRLFGKIALKKNLREGHVLDKNTPTLPQFVIKENGDVLAQKKAWIALVEAYADFSSSDFVHPFFGKMTKEEIGILTYKHTDHHLRQFNC